MLCEDVTVTPTNAGMRTVIRTVVETEQDSGPDAVELIEHVCAPALPRATTVQAAVMTATAIARDEDMGTPLGWTDPVESGHPDRLGDGRLCLEGQPHDEPGGHGGAIEADGRARV